MSWGFRTRRDAVNTKHATRQVPPRPTVSQPANYQFAFVAEANYLAKTPPSGIPPLVGDTPGESDCDIYYVNDAGDLVPSQKTDLSGTNPDTLFLPVKNISPAPISGDVYVFTWQVGDKWVTVGEVPTVCIAQAIDVKVLTCIIYSTAPPITGYFGATENPEWEVDCTIVPPEATDLGGGDYSIEFSNPNKLTAVAGSIIQLQRKEDELGNVTWILHSVGRDDQIARYCRTQNPASGQLSGPPTFWEGGNPFGCSPTPTVVCEFDCSCLTASDWGIGCYDPENNQYRIISTASALLGPATQVPLISNPRFVGCTLEYTEHTARVFTCGTTPTLDSTTLPSGIIKSVTGFTYAGNGNVCLTWQEITVPICAVGSSSAACVNICDILCDCPQLISVPEICDPPVPDCSCLDCLFIEGPTGLTVNTPTCTFNSISITPTTDPCQWTAEMHAVPAVCESDGGDDFNITYMGDGNWRVSGFPDDGNFVLNGQGDCAGAALTGDPGYDGFVLADGITCKSFQCCEVFDGDERVDELDGTDGDFDITLRPDAVGIAPGSDGPCGVSFDVGVLVHDNLLDEGCESEVHAELRYDLEINGDPAENGCRWHVTIEPCSGAGGMTYPGDGYAVYSCLGGGCAGALGTCGSSQDLKFIIRDPNTSVLGDCVEPPAALLMALLESAEGLPIRITDARLADGLGDQFVKDNRELFIGCGCKKDVRHVMNRWERGQVDDQPIQIVSKTIANKSPKHTAAQVETIIREFLDGQE